MQTANLSKQKFYSFLVVAGLFFSPFSYADTNTPQISCNKICQAALQNTVAQFRETNDMNAMSLSISLPGDNGTIQPTQTFYAGYVQKGSSTPMGALNEQGQPINLMGIASITKSFTAAIILQLEAEGRLNLSDTVGMYLPRYPDWSNITIKQLLNMTSGIYDYEEGDTAAFWNQVLLDPYYNWTPEELMTISYDNTQKTSECPNGGNTCFTPGTSWYYSNAAYMLLGMIITQITGQSYEDVLNERLLGPNSTLHQLNNTYYEALPYSNDMVSRMVHQYLVGVSTPIVSPVPDATFINLSWDGPAGAILSNTQDLVTWTRLLYQTNQVLPAPQENKLRELVCKYASNSSLLGQPIAATSMTCPWGYGLGVMQMYTENNGLVWYYSGADLGVNSFYLYYEKYNLVLAIQASINETPNFNNYLQFFNQINQALGLPANILPLLPPN